MGKYKYRIKGIYHSGRKGTRWDPVMDEEYDGLIGQLCTFVPDEIEQFRGIAFYLKNHPFYRWWNTSNVLQLSRDLNGDYVVETVNSIYVFEEIKDGD